MPTLGITPRQRYDELLTRSRKDNGVKGPLGIPGWKPASKKTIKDLIAMGKLEPTLKHLKATSSGKSKGKVVARASVKRIGSSPAIPPGMSKEDLAQIMQRNKDKGMIILG